LLKINNKFELTFTFAAILIFYRKIIAWVWLVALYL